MLWEVSFPRHALNEKYPYGLYIFCDSLAEAYGFVTYAVDEEGRSTYLHSKSKLAPLNKGNEHSIPTLGTYGCDTSIKVFAYNTTGLSKHPNTAHQYLWRCSGCT